MANVTEYPPFLANISTTISNGQTASAAVDLSGTTLVGIQMPAAFTGTTLTFQVATSSGGTYQTMIDSSGSSVSCTVSASKYLSLNPATFAGIRYLKIVSGSSEGATRTLELITRPV